ncbi:MAG: glycosyltransferase family 39 protein [Nanoarchaeota archaeon]
MEEKRLSDLAAKYFPYILTGIFLLSLFLRWKYFNINSAVWYDEGSYLAQARLWGFDLSLEDNYYFRRTFFLPILWAGLYKIGLGELSLHFTELVFSFVAVVYTYLLGKFWFNKYVGAIAAFVLGTSWLHLFFTSRLLTDVPALAFIIPGIYYFLKGYPEKPKLMYLAAILISLSIFTRLGYFITVVPILVYIITKEKLKFLKNKHLWIMLIIFLIILTPFFIKFFSYEGANEGVKGSLIHYFTGREILIFDYIKNLNYIYQGTFIFLAAFGLTYFTELFLGLDIIFKNEKIRRKLFMLVWILMPIIIFGLVTAVVEERYLMLTLPMFALLIGYASEKISSVSDRLFKSKIFGVVIVLLLLGFGGYSQVVFADELIVSKRDTFIHLKFAGEWIKENSEPTDRIISSGQPQLLYYSDRNIDSYTSTAEQFPEKINLLKPKYMLITRWEPSPDWTYSWPQENQDKVKPVKAWYFDEAQTQPAVIIYEFVNTN